MTDLREPGDRDAPLDLEAPHLGLDDLPSADATSAAWAYFSHRNHTMITGDARRALEVAYAIDVLPIVAALRDARQRADHEHGNAVAMLRKYESAIAEADKLEAALAAAAERESRWFTTLDRLLDAVTTDPGAMETADAVIGARKLIGEHRKQQIDAALSPTSTEPPKDVLGAGSPEAGT